MTARKPAKKRDEPKYAGPNTCVDCGEWCEACDEYLHCAPMTAKRAKPKRYDYVKAVDDSLWHEPNGEFRHKTVRILRKLVREAVNEALGTWHTAGSEAEMADRVARRLVP